MRTRTKIVSASAGGMLALGLGVGVPALAADSDEGSSDGSSSVEDRRADLEERRDEAERAFAERLADELGLDADVVAAAVGTVRTALAEERATEHLAALEERLGAQVESGALTQEQADVLRELAQQRAEDGEGGFGFGHGPGRGPAHGPGPGGSGGPST